MALTSGEGAVRAVLAMLAPKVADTKVHVVVELRDADPPMAAIAQAGKALDWLAEEPDLYTDADLAEPAH
jgi:hypothetical protein